MLSVSKTIPVRFFLLDFFPVACMPIFASGSSGPTSAWLNVLASNFVGKPRILL